MTRALLLGAAACALYVASFPPLDLGWLAFAALAPWAWLVRRLGGARLFFFAWLVGASIFTIGCFWLRKSSPINLVLMVVPESLAFALFALLLRRLHVNRGWPAAIALPLAFVPVEFARGHWPLDGYPWLTLGYTQHAHLGVVQLATLGGVHLLSALLATAAGLFADAFPSGSGRLRRAVALAGGVVVAIELCGRGMLRDADALERGPRLLLLQPAIEQQLKNAGTSDAEILRRHVELADAADAARNSDLLVWSETFLPFVWRESDETPADEPPALTRLRDHWRREVVGAMPRRYSQPLLAGAVTLRESEVREETPRLNSALLFDRDGTISADYSKRLLVPGGEYVPWIDSFPKELADWIRAQIRKLAGSVPNLLPGDKSGLIDLAVVGQRGRVGLTICYEIAYPQLGVELTRAGADFLLNLSNEAWFPDSAEFAQYSAMAVVRAVETRRTMVRCANSGTSGHVDPWGRPHWLERDGRRDGFAGSMVVAPPIREGRTLYVRVGDAFAWLLSALAVGAALLRARP
jgi:apolipoprotein N-acyltransferase